MYQGGEIKLYQSKLVLVICQKDTTTIIEFGVTCHTKCQHQFALQLHKPLRNSRITVMDIDTM